MGLHPIRAQNLLTRSHGRVIKSHPGHLPLLSSRSGIEILREFLYVSNIASSKRLYYVMEITSHPTTRLVVISASICLKCNSARRGLPYQMAVKSDAKIGNIS